jgi:enamine deaminase RidA (YjgF/YER057c/UK114 family)
MVVEVGGTRQFFIAGQVARDKNGNCVGLGDMRAQIEQVGKNAGACLTAAGATVDDIVYTTRFVTAPSEFDKHADLLPHYFGPPSAESKTVHEPQLSNPDFLVEVEGIAAIK